MTEKNWFLMKSAIAIAEKVQLHLHLCIHPVQTYTINFNKYLYIFTYDYYIIQNSVSLHIHFEILIYRSASGTFHTFWGCWNDAFLDYKLHIRNVCTYIGQYSPFCQ